MKKVTAGLLPIFVSTCLFAQSPQTPTTPTTPTIANVQDAPHHSHRKLWAILIVAGGATAAAIVLTKTSQHNNGLTGNIPPTPGQNGITVLPGTFK